MSQRSGDNLKLALLVEQINKRYGFKRLIGYEKSMYVTSLVIYMQYWAGISTRKEIRI